MLAIPERAQVFGPRFAVYNFWMISPQATSDAAIAIRNKVWENDAAQIAGRLFYPELSGTGIVYTYNPRRFEQLATDTEAGEHFHVARS